ncbi:MAG: tyrosine-type recombinase/integrase [Prevotellaceae bacterium]|jgi:integrase|nr:tyrosine-type recombinase/integrase [Prevotellaceae bacterium]
MRIFTKQQPAPRVRLTDCIYAHINTSRYSAKQKRTYRNVATHVARFEAKTGIIIYVDSFTESHAHEFIYYLRSDARRKGNAKAGNGLMQNSVANIWHKVACVLNKASRGNSNVNQDFRNIKLQKEDANAVYLTLEELARLNALKGLSTGARAVRDMFLVGCFSALRLSDYSQLTAANIIHNNIEVKTRKTGAKVVIPIHPVVRGVLQRNKGDFPKIPSAQSFNDTVKRVCRQAGITDEVLYERTVGVKIVRKRVKKHTLVTSHTARRTAATNMYLAGISVYQIMLITGHTTEQAFFRYIRIGREENAKKLAEHNFFSGELAG